MVREDGQLGVSTLRLLAERGSVGVLRELAEGARQPSELEQRLPDAGHTLLQRRLGQLVQAGAVTRTRVSTVPPRAYYALTDSGLGLLPICEAAERWERRRASSTLPGAHGTWAMRLLSDEGNRAIFLTLASDPLRPTDVGRHLPQLANSSTRRRLDHLLTNGILARTHPHRQVRYELTAAARGLGLIATLAARWEWRSGNVGKPRPAGDLPGLLRLLAPATHVPESLGGVCRLCIGYHPAEPVSVNLLARAGALTALTAAPKDPPQAVGHAPAHAWCDALLHRRLAGIATTGNTALMAGVLMSVSTMLAA